MKQRQGGETGNGRELVREGLSQEVTFGKIWRKNISEESKYQRLQVGFILLDWRNNRESSGRRQGGETRGRAMTGRPHRS